MPVYTREDVTKAERELVAATEERRRWETRVKHAIMPRPETEAGVNALCRNVTEALRGRADADRAEGIAYTRYYRIIDNYLGKDPT